jgi:DNA modification methylase
MKVSIHNADCLKILKGMPDCSVDSIVTDPPYGLSFMGKRWDYDVPSVEVWQECLRVLKPGGHLLAFAGTRTQHRMAVRIEDAGFEIRDMIAWCYGSGFPKSLDVSKAIDKAAGAEREVVGKNPNHRGVSGVVYDGVYHGSNTGNPTITAPATEAAKQWQGWGTALKPSWESVTWARKPLPAEEERRTIVASLLRLESKLWLLQHVNAVKSNSPSSQSEFAEALSTAQWTVDDCINTQAGLCDQMGMSVFASAISMSLNTVWLWKSILADAWSNTSTSTTSTESSTIIDWKTLKSCLLAITPESMLAASSLPGGYLVNACTAGKVLNGWLLSLQATRELSATESATSLARTNFQDVDVSPNLDPIVVARKPLCGTVAENVLQHGTGGLNVDGCRVGTEPPAPRNAPKKIMRGGKFHAAADTETEMSHYNPTQGRWPANFIHDGSDEVVGLFPSTAPARKTDRGKGIDGPTFRHAAGQESGVRGHNDNGGSAARFFYCAKSSKKDRGEGNNHPTVKPTDLMRYLCRLVTPPNGTVLDPYMGSGSTGKAAVLEEFSFIGIEMNAEYYAIARTRIKSAKGVK